MDVKLAMIKVFLPRIQFVHIDILIKELVNLVSRAHKADGIMVCNINPLLVAASILQISDSIKTDFPLAKLRIESYEQELEETTIKFLEKLHDPYKISKLLK